MTKKEWISHFREIGKSILEDLENSEKTNKGKTSEINTRITKHYKDKIKAIKSTAKKERWDNQVLLNEILIVTYASYIVMLECRNTIWEYDYMAFSRRIGELWEPFCKLAFTSPVNSLSIIKPPKFYNVQAEVKQNATKYIDCLDLNNDIKKHLKGLYEIPWTIVDSGNIKLGLDLHFEQDGIHYNCDFKSGFSSNEKGNTNRLLLVASIYNNFLGAGEKAILFVRQPEDENNHYLQTLKNSPYWDVYCANDAYAAMKHFTGFDMRKWLDDNVDWQNDISDDLKNHLQKNDLLKYLTW